MERGLVLIPGVANLKVVDIVIKAVIVNLMAVFVAKRDSAYPYLRVCHSDPLQTRTHSTISAISLN